MDVKYLELSKLRVSPINVRRTINPTLITDLADNITTYGLLQPITVVKNEDSSYDIIAGQRRYLAMKHLKRKKMPCSIIKADAHKREEISSIENVQRSQMNMSDTCRAYSRLYEVNGRDIKVVARKINVGAKTIERYIRVSNLPEPILDRLDSQSRFPFVNLLPVQ